MTTQKVGESQVPQDLAFQKRVWKVERAGWTVMALIAAAALAGLIGEGPLSEATSGGSEERVKVEYQRFGRRHAPQTLRFYIAAPPNAEGKVKLSIDREYLESIEIETVLPEPETVEGGPDFHTFEFATAEGVTTVSFKMMPEAMGSLKGSAFIQGRPPVQFHQFVYP